MYMFVLCPRGTSSYTFSGCTLEIIRFSRLRYEQILVAKQVVSKLYLSAKQLVCRQSDPDLSFLIRKYALEEYNGKDHRIENSLSLVPQWLSNVFTTKYNTSSSIN
jgi:hypothetical protein